MDIYSLTDTAHRCGLLLLAAGATLLGTSTLYATAPAASAAAEHRQADPDESERLQEKLGALSARLEALPEEAGQGDADLYLQKAVLEQYLEVIPEHRRGLLLPLLSNIAVDLDERLDYYEQLPEGGSSRELAVYREMKDRIRNEMAAPGTLDPERLRETFALWTAAVKDLGPASSFSRAEFFLCRAEFALNRDKNIDQARHWLGEFQTIREGPLQSLVREIRHAPDEPLVPLEVMDAREQQLTGDLARWRDDEAAARRHYEIAREMIAPYLERRIMARGMVAADVLGDLQRQLAERLGEAPAPELDPADLSIPLLDVGVAESPIIMESMVEQGSSVPRVVGLEKAPLSGEGDARPRPSPVAPPEVDEATRSSWQPGEGADFAAEWAGEYEGIGDAFIREEATWFREVPVQVSIGRWKSGNTVRINARFKGMFDPLWFLAEVKSFTGSAGEVFEDGMIPGSVGTHYSRGRTRILGRGARHKYEYSLTKNGDEITGKVKEYTRREAPQPFMPGEEWTFKVRRTSTSMLQPAIPPGVSTRFVTSWVGEYIGVGDFYRQRGWNRDGEFVGDTWTRDVEAQVSVRHRDNQLHIRFSMMRQRPLAELPAITVEVEGALLENTDQISGSQKLVRAGIEIEVDYSFKKVGRTLTGRVELVRPIRLSGEETRTRQEFVFTHLKKQK